MKKIAVLFTFLILCFSVTSFAALDELSSDGDDGNGADAQFTLTDSGSDTDDLTFGLSPNVVARYINPGTSDATGQWYSIGTVHSGGTKAFGTTQDLNNMYIKDYATGTAITNAIVDIPANSVSANAWNEGWDI